MKAYIIKYALTAGIIETGIAENLDNVRIRANIGMASDYFHKGEWFPTRELAISRAEIMRDHRIQALEKQIARLKGLVFK
jgi:hypothetical protein